jgi:hypothetical protein
MDRCSDMNIIQLETVIAFLCVKSSMTMKEKLRQE